jgi:hypothetical protein
MRPAVINLCSATANKDIKYLDNFLKTCHWCHYEQTKRLYSNRASGGDCYYCIIDGNLNPSFEQGTTLAFAERHYISWHWRDQRAIDSGNESWVISEADAGIEKISLGIFGIRYLRNTKISINANYRRGLTALRYKFETHLDVI